VIRRRSSNSRYRCGRPGSALGPAAAEKPQPRRFVLSTIFVDGANLRRTGSLGDVFGCRCTRMQLFFRKTRRIGLFALPLAGCDALWIQRSTVRLQAHEFPQCVDAALADVPGVSVDTRHCTVRNLVLATPLQSGSCGPFAYIARQPDAGDRAVVQVRFAQWDARNPERSRAQISLLLHAITRSLERHCGRELSPTASRAPSDP